MAGSVLHRNPSAGSGVYQGHGAGGRFGSVASKQQPTVLAVGIPMSGNAADVLQVGPAQAKAQYAGPQVIQPGAPSGGPVLAQPAPGPTAK